MKIISFVVRLLCTTCEGKKTVPGGQREYGELVKCRMCGGKGTTEGHVLYEDFAKLIEGVSKIGKKG